MRLDLLRPWLVTAALLLTADFASAHDIPNDVTVQAFLKPTGDRLHLLVRVPLKAMRDVDFPARGKEGFLDIERTGTADVQRAFGDRGDVVERQDQVTGDKQVAGLRCASRGHVFTVRSPSSNSSPAG